MERNDDQTRRLATADRACVSIYFGRLRKISLSSNLIRSPFKIRLLFVIHPIILELCNGGRGAENRVMPLPNGQRSLTLCGFDITTSRTDGRTERQTEMVKQYRALSAGAC